MTKWSSLFSLTLISLLLFTACGATEEPPEPTPTTPPTSTAVPQNSTSTPEPTPTTPPTATPTPLPPEIDIDYQILDSDSTLTINSVTTPQDSWLVIYPDSRLELSADLVLGYTTVAAGQESNITVELPTELDITSLQVALHSQNPADAGEFNPTSNNLILIRTTEIDTPATLPTLIASDQPLIQNEEETTGHILIDTITSPTAAWIALYPADDADLTNLLGYAPVPAGTTQNVPVFYRWRDAPSHIQAILLEDAGETNLFEIELDQLIDIGGEPLIANLRVTMPPNMLIYNQPVANSFTIERVISDGPGWIVVYEDADEDGQPGFLIGTAPLLDGLNEKVVVEVDGTAVSPNLLVTLHHDTGVLDEFDFPANDARQDFGGVAHVTPFRTDIPALILTTPQALTENTLIIPRLAIGHPVWAVIYADDDGRRGTTVLGTTWLPLGYHFNTEIEIDTTSLTNTVHLALHHDEGAEKQFEPDEFDFAVKLRGVDLGATIPTQR